MFCPKYIDQRLTLYQQIEQIIPTIRKLPHKRQYKIFMFGYETNNPEMLKINRQIMLATQKYIINSKRYYDYK